MFAFPATTGWSNKDPTSSVLLLSAQGCQAGDGRIMTVGGGCLTPGDLFLDAAAGKRFRNWVQSMWWDILLLPALLPHTVTVPTAPITFSGCCTWSAHRHHQVTQQQKQPRTLSLRTLTHAADTAVTITQRRWIQNSHNLTKMAITKAMSSSWYGWPSPLNVA